MPPGVQLLLQGWPFQEPELWAGPSSSPRAFVQQLGTSQPDRAPCILLPVGQHSSSLVPSPWPPPRPALWVLEGAQLPSAGSSPLPSSRPQLPRTACAEPAPGLCFLQARRRLRRDWERALLPAGPGPGPGRLRGPWGVGPDRAVALRHSAAPLCPFRVRRGRWASREAGGGRSGWSAARYVSCPDAPGHVGDRWSLGPPTEWGVR